MFREGRVGVTGLWCGGGSEVWVAERGGGRGGNPADPRKH